MSSRIGIDVGGTFTDAIAIDDATGEINRTKVLTTADDQSRGTLEAIGRLSGDGAGLRQIVHGYTVGLNAALTRRGAKTGMLVTAGHRGLIDTGRLTRPLDDSLYDSTWERPHDARPIVDRRLRREVPERLREDGEVLLPVDAEATRAELELLKAEGVEAVGICFIHGYAHPEHERQVRELVEEVLPGAYVQTSDIWPLAREYERSFVVMMDAYTGPPVIRYLENLERRLREQEIDVRLDIMQMDGGLRSSTAVRRAPIYTLQSGPVAGLLGAEFYTRRYLGGTSLACVDIGGTSTDIGIIVDGEAEVTNEWQLEHGIPLSLTTLDVRSIGAGGGSLIDVDELGTLQVGPESAGSEPGPACYGQGGERPAMTDAYVALGLLQPELFLGGEMRLDAAAAERALAAVAAPSGLDAGALARGAYGIANVKIAAAVREMTVDRGMDPRTFSLLGYGAAGPMHAVEVARLLDIAEVVVPYFPGGFSAFGMIASRSKVSYSAAILEPLMEVGPERLDEILGGLAARCREDLERDGVDPGSIEISYSYKGMYAGQGHDNRQPLPVELDDAALASTAERFHDFYDARFGYRAPEIPIIVTSVMATATGPAPGLELPQAEGERSGGIEEAVTFRRPVHLEAEPAEACFYDRTKLIEGDEIDGPAVIDDGLGTIVVPAGATARVAEHGVLRIEV
jgi:N-methylhydantoinase A